MSTGVEGKGSEERSQGIVCEEGTQCVQRSRDEQMLPQEKVTSGTTKTKLPTLLPCYIEGQKKRCFVNSLSWALQSW